LVEEQAARVSESAVRALVAVIRAEIGSGRSLVNVPQTHLVGEEAEVDFGEFYAVIAGQMMKVWMFVLRLSHSGRAVHFAITRRSRSWTGMCRRSPRWVGYRDDRYDNDPGGGAVLLGRDREENLRFVAMRSHYGYDSFFCIPGIEGAHEKGGVEGEIGRFRRRHLTPVPHVGSLAALNAALAAADARDDARRIAALTETVGAAFEREQVVLNPLPTTISMSRRCCRAGSIPRPGSVYGSPTIRSRPGWRGGGCRCVWGPRP
jgi:hypothetical protein